VLAKNSLKNEDKDTFEKTMQLVKEHLRSKISTLGDT
jgi:hypothetical protein